VDDVVEHVSQRALGLGGEVETRAELRLASGSLHEDDEVTRDVAGELGAVVGLDEREAEVDPGGDARGGMDGAVVDEDRVRVEGDLRVGAGELGGDLPVGGGAAAVEQPGRGEDERADAHRRGAAAAPRGTGDSPASRFEYPRRSVAPTSAGRHVQRHREGAGRLTGRARRRALDPSLRARTDRGVTAS
jgi:hypothetical protein